jgi:hypothetical protein
MAEQKIILMLSFAKNVFKRYNPLKQCNIHRTLHLRISPFMTKPSSFSTFPEKKPLEKIFGTFRISPYPYPFLILYLILYTIIL